ncbi:MAG: multiprotein bridging factor aMBF1 [Candidatus Marsarchaeota archaeon]|nr:multiprotein bridging factor aMBF1 [Candidatus Marsarchaeota archaeon]
MEECELCGKSTDSAYVVLVEGVELRVCASCANGKKVLSHRPTDSASRGYHGTYQKTAKKSIDEPPLVDNYGRVIREARERLKIPIKVLAEMINEKETFLSRVEAEKAAPPAQLIKKLEKTLNIKLTASRSEAEDNQHYRSDNGVTTIGDFA